MAAGEGDNGREGICEVVVLRAVIGVGGGMVGTVVCVPSLMLGR